MVWEDPAVCELGTGKGWQLPSVGTWRFPQYPCVWDSSHTGLLPRLAGSAVPPPSANKDTSQIGQCQVTLYQQELLTSSRDFPAKAGLALLSHTSSLCHLGIGCLWPREKQGRLLHRRLRPGPGGLSGLACAPAHQSLTLPLISKQYKGHIPRELSACLWPPPPYLGHHKVGRGPCPLPLLDSHRL